MASAKSSLYRFHDCSNTVLYDTGQRTGRLWTFTLYLVLGTEQARVNMTIELAT